MLHLFGQKNDKLLEASKMYRLVASAIQNAKKNIKLNALQNSYIGLKFYILIPNPKFWFLIINAYKTQTLNVIKKWNLHVIKLETNNTHARFQNNILIFDCACAMVKKKQVKQIASLLWNAFLEDFQLLYVKINDIFGNLGQAGQYRHFFNSALDSAALLQGYASGYHKNTGFNLISQPAIYSLGCGWRLCGTADGWWSRAAYGCNL